MKIPQLCGFLESQKALPAQTGNVAATFVSLPGPSGKPECGADGGNGPSVGLGARESG